MFIIKYIIIFLLIIIIIKIIYDEKKIKENYINVSTLQQSTNTKFDTKINDMNNVIRQEQDINNPKKQNYMEFDKLRVTNKLKSKKVNINTIKFKTHDLTISDDGELYIKDKNGKIIWTSKHLYNAKLYDSSGQYVFFIDNFNNKYPLSYPTTHLFNTNNTHSNNTHSNNTQSKFEDWERVKNIALYGEIYTEDILNKFYKLCVNSNIFYKTPGIEIKNIYIPNTKIVLGLKQGKIQYNNCYLRSMDMTMDMLINKKIELSNTNELQSGKIADCGNPLNKTPTEPNRLIYGCQIYWIDEDAIISNSKIIDEDIEKDVEKMVYPYHFSIKSPFTLFQKLTLIAGMPGFVALSFIPGLEGMDSFLYEIYAIRSQIECGILRVFMIVFDGCIMVAGKIAYFMQNAAGEIAYFFDGSVKEGFNMIGDKLEAIPNAVLTGFVTIGGGLTDFGNSVGGAFEDVNWGDADPSGW